MRILLRPSGEPPPGNAEPKGFSLPTFFLLYEILIIPRLERASSFLTKKKKELFVLCVIYIVTLVC